MEAVLLSPSGRTVLSSAVVSIGSAADNQVVVNDAKVSPHHAEMNLIGESYSITDLVSKNGTFVNEQRLASNGAYLLNASDMIRVGDTHLRYLGSDVAQATPAVGQGSSLGYQPTSTRAATPTSSTSIGSVVPTPPPVAASSVPSSRETILLSSSGQTVLKSAVVSIGSAADNQIVVNDAKVSPHHAEIRAVGEGYSITDLDSTNGTFVNGQQLASNVAHPLNAGDIIRAGNTPFRYEDTGAPQVASSGSATPSQASSSEYQPTAAVASLSSTNSSSLEQQASVAPTAAVASLPSTNPSSLKQQASVAPTAAVASLSSTNPSSLKQQASVAPTAVPSSGIPAQPQKKSSRKAVVVLSIAAILVIILAIIYGVFTFLGGSTVLGDSTPTKTLDTFCGSLKSGDFDMAYSQLSGPRQTKITVEGFRRLFTSVRSCTFSSVKESDASHATATITFLGTTGGPVSAPTDLVLEQQTWKIDAINI